MVTFAQLLSFTLTAILITATPGPDNLMVLGMGMSKGPRQGIAFGSVSYTHLTLPTKRIV